MGQPSESEPWGWQIEGHHLAINYFVLGDQVVMSPVFIGSEPVKATNGKFKGTEILQREQDLGLAFMQSLSEPCLLYTSPSPRDRTRSRMPSSA